MGGMWTIYEQLRRNEALSDIFTWNIYFTIVLCLNILWLKAVNEITADYTTRQLRKHGLIKVCSIEYLTMEIELVLPTFKSWTKEVLNHSHNYIEYLTLELLSSHLNIYHSTTAYFFEPPVYLSHWEAFAVIKLYSIEVLAERLPHRHVRYCVISSLFSVSSTDLFLNRNL